MVFFNVRNSLTISPSVNRSNLTFRTSPMLGLLCQELASVATAQKQHKIQPNSNKYLQRIFCQRVSHAKWCIGVARCVMSGVASDSHVSLLLAALPGLPSWARRIRLIALPLRLVAAAPLSQINRTCIQDKPNAFKTDAKE